MSHEGCNTKTTTGNKSTNGTGERVRPIVTVHTQPNKKLSISDGTEELTDILVSPPTSESSNDRLRTELPWEKREEARINKMSMEAKQSAVVMNTKARHTKRLYAMFGIPTIFLPLLLAALEKHIPSNLPYISTIILLFITFFSTISTFYNFGKKSATYFQYEAEFDKLYNNIQSELCKPRAHRIACDVFLSDVTIRLNHIKADAPP